MLLFPLDRGPMLLTPPRVCSLVSAPDDLLKRQGQVNIEFVIRNSVKTRAFNQTRERSRVDTV